MKLFMAAPASFLPLASALHDAACAPPATSERTAATRIAFMVGPLNDDVLLPGLATNHEADRNKLCGLRGEAVTIRTEYAIALQQGFALYLPEPDGNQARRIAIH